MRVKKYPQSHLVISDGTSKILIDPGNLTFNSGYGVEDFSDIDAFLLTHSHPDHVDPEHAKELIGGKPAFGNSDVVSQLKNSGVNVTEIHDGQEFEAAGFKVKAIDLPHCKMKDGTDGPPNTGFLVEGVLFHPGDGDIAPEGLKSDDLALPIAGPTITLDSAMKFVQDVEAKIVIPIHYDYFKNDPQEFKRMAAEKNIEVRVLAPGEETEI